MVGILKKSVPIFIGHSIGDAFFNITKEVMMMKGTALGAENREMNFRTMHMKNSTTKN